MTAILNLHAKSRFKYMQVVFILFILKYTNSLLLKRKICLSNLEQFFSGKYKKIRGNILKLNSAMIWELKSSLPISNLRIRVII